MKRTGIWALLLLLSLCCNATATAHTGGSFSGHWHWEHAKEELDLYLRQTKDKIDGRHSAIGQNGLKADEVSDDQPPSITGTVSGDTAVVAFRSGFPDSNGRGKARLVLKGDTLHWKIVESSGEYYLPLRATLTRQKH